MKYGHPYNFIQLSDGGSTIEKKVGRHVPKFSEDVRRPGDRAYGIAIPEVCMVLDCTSYLDECTPGIMTSAHDLRFNTIRLTRILPICGTNRSDVIYIVIHVKT
jgi:hypothetical protein